MPHSTISFLDAYDRQETIIDCLSSVVDLISPPEQTRSSFHQVERNDFSLLLSFLNTELIDDHSFSSLTYSKKKRQKLFMDCYGAISDLTCVCDDLHIVKRGNLFFILSFLHQELKRMNDIIYFLNEHRINDVRLDKKGYVIQNEQPFSKNVLSIASGVNV